VANLPFRNAHELMEVSRRNNMTIAQIVYENERRWRTDVEIKRGLLEIWRHMDMSITNGCWSTQSTLPGGLHVKRRAPVLFKRLMQKTMVRCRFPKACADAFFCSLAHYAPWTRKAIQPLCPHPSAGRQAQGSSNARLPRLAIVFRHRRERRERLWRPRRHRSHQRRGGGDPGHPEVLFIVYFQ